MSNIVYRYINWNDSKARRFLTKNELFFYSAKSWEDNGEYNFNLDTLDENKISERIYSIVQKLYNYDFLEYQAWMNYQAHTYSINLNSLAECELDLVDQYFSKRRANQIISNPDDYKQSQKNLFFERTGIFCLSDSKRSYSLWNNKRNALSDNVVCIGIEEDILTEVILTHRNCTMNKINYENEIPKYEIKFDTEGYDTMLQLLTIVYQLPKTYASEEEIRIHRLFIDNSVGSKERIIDLTDSMFKEVIILEEADIEVKREIIDIARSKGIEKIRYAKIIDYNIEINPSS